MLLELVPGRDGLVLEWRGMRATFLPKVWEHVAGPRDFLRRLKEKAGLSADFWAADVQLWRYETEIMAVERPATLEAAPAICRVSAARRRFRRTAMARQST